MNSSVAVDLVYFKNFWKIYFVHTCKLMEISENISANIYLFKVNNGNTRKKYEICSKLTVKTPERRH